MKKLILCIVIFAALCALAAGSYFYIVGTTARLLNKVEFVARSFSEGDLQAARDSATEAEEIWIDFRRHRHLIVDRGSEGEITSTLARMRALAEDGDDEAAVESKAASALLMQYIEKQWVNLYNIL